MGRVFEDQRRAVAQRLRANVEDIPVYKVKTPLQRAIQILKQHRDIYFCKNPEIKPISIILTTLSAHAYQQETRIADALYAILRDMDTYIERRNGVVWIANPSDPFENFADKWHQKPELEHAFRTWLRQAREDFSTAGRLLDRSQLIQFLSGRLGSVVGKATAAREAAPAPRGLVAAAASRLNSLFSASHRETPRWPMEIRGVVRIARAWVSRDGFRATRIESNGPPVAKHGSLRFEAETSVPSPFKIFWQVVNTGTEAQSARCLRGRFEEFALEKGGLTKEESTPYSGTHWIECFIVKDGCLVARSGEFIVDID